MALSGESVVAAGAELAGRAGLDAVSVRAVAGVLHVTPMALYRHVDDARSLYAAVVERLLADLPLVGDVGPWDERCRAWAHAARSVLAPVPGLARHVLTSWIHLPRVLAALEGLVVTLEHDGPAGVDAVAGANAVLVHVLMRAQAEEAVRAGGLRRDLATLRSLRSELPALWAHREEYRRARLDEHFAYGLDALLHGLASTRRAS
jgi:AcrR family transcriptional regulator